MSKIVCIYSVNGDYSGGIKNIDGKDGIYIYKNSHKDIDNLSIGDIVLFFKTDKKEVVSFEIKSEDFLHTEETDEEKEKYFLLIDEESKKEFTLPIADFKNLYFLNQEVLKPWIKSPLQYYKNTITFETSDEIITSYLKYDNLVKALSEYKDYIRKYYFTYEKSDIDKLLKGKQDKFQNVVTYIENDAFITEYSIFSQKGKQDILNFNIKFNELSKLYKRNNQNRLKKIKNNKFFETDSYGIYYEITRTNNGEKIEENNNIEDNKYSISNIINSVKQSQIISEEQLYNILISLTVNNFLIFSGPSGTGKTSVVEKIAKSLDGGFHKLPIKSNFTDESAILGYWNPLLSRYEGTETLKFLIDAYKRDESELNFLLLDEMNLSKVENYFSTFLSEIDKLKDYDNLEEKDKPKILLFETNITNKKQYENIKYFLENYFGKDFGDYENNIEFNGNLKDYGESKTDKSGNFTKEIKSIKVFLKLKNNIKIIGTINEDETTNSISNKVLDRAQFITFEVGDLFRGDIVGKPFLDVLLIQNNSFFDDIFNIKIKIKAKEDNEKNLKEYFSNAKDDLQKIENIINAINKEIQNISINESIGYRAIEEIMTYIKNYCNYNSGNSITGLAESLDNQISQKVLTKLKTFSLVSEDSKKAFKEIGEILEKLEYKDGENIIKINLEGKLEKSINFYKHLKNNLLD